MQYGTYEFHGSQNHRLSELSRIYDGTKRVALIYSHGMYADHNTVFELFANCDDAQARLNQLALAAVNDTSIEFHCVVKLGVVHKIHPAEVVKSWRIDL